jgi:CubicO group peptidase (beta-lactamase class C family)
MASTHVPGVAVAVVETGEYEWATGFGLADVENNVPASEHTLFRLGSISKSSTATAAMQLWERGQLDLDAHASSHLSKI